MSMRCELTGKSFQTGNNVSHAKNRTKRRLKPNLQSITFYFYYGEILKKMILPLSSNNILCQFFFDDHYLQKCILIFIQFSYTQSQNNLD